MAIEHAATFIQKNWRAHADRQKNLSKQIIRNPFKYIEQEIKNIP